MWLELRFRTAISQVVPRRWVEELTKLHFTRREGEMPRAKLCSTTWELQERHSLISMLAQEATIQHREAINETKPKSWMLVKKLQTAFSEAASWVANKFKKWSVNKEQTKTYAKARKLWTWQTWVEWPTPLSSSTTWECNPASKEPMAAKVLKASNHS